SDPAHEGGCDGARTHPRARTRAAVVGQKQTKPPPRAESLYEANRRAVQSVEMARHRQGKIADGDGRVSRTPGGSGVSVFPAGDADPNSCGFGLLYFCHRRFWAEL